MQKESKVCRIKVDFGKKIGFIKPLHGINCGPLSEKGSIDLSSYYSDLNVPYIRLHDVPEAGIPAIDIHLVFHLVFPDFDADPNMPESYDFAWTDRYLETINKIGAGVIYQLGYSYKDPPVHNVPPKDYEKWESIYVHIVKHYNDGWADGHHYNIRYGRYGTNQT